MERIDEVLVALRRIIRATDLHSKYLAKTTGLTAPQILLLQTLRNKGEDTVGGLAKEMSLSQATVTTICLLYTSPSPRDRTRSRMPSSA